MQDKELETFCPASRQDWRRWLEDNHRSKASIWLLYFKKKSNTPSISYSDAVDEALCFGWIDSTKKTLDEHSYIQFFCPRKPRSGWSKVNKAKVLQLTEDGLMTAAGFESIERAKANGSWTTLDAIEELHTPPDLEAALESMPGAMDIFLGLSKSDRKLILHRLASAKRPETRLKRLEEILGLLAQKQKPG